MQNLPLPPARQGTYESPMMRFSDEQFDPSVTWHDLEVFVESAPLPVLIKGIMHPGDALRASETGVAGLIVSNHGGRQLDGVISTLDALPPIVDAVGARSFELILDGGVRRGTDVVKAMALGAKMVLIGRPVLWGLAVAGEQGASHVLEILRSELDTALALIGCPRVSDLDLGYLQRVVE
jgi:4-hydroxymandelate oxidase